MTKAVYDVNGDNIVDHAALADTAPWTGISGKPATFPSDWTTTANKPTTFPPSAHAASHVTGGSDVIAPASATAAGLLKQLSGLTTDFVDGTNTCQNLVTAVGPTIWSVRLRSFNALGNTTFEVDQRNVGAVIANPTNNVPVIDRWAPRKAGTMAFSAGQQVAAANEVLVPGTNFAISRNFFRITLTTQQASLAAGDSLRFGAVIEGPRFRELQYDVHSISLLVRSSVAGLKFSVALQDSPVTKSLVKLCTIPNAATWTMIPLANLPVFPAGNFTAAQGVIGYFLAVCLACGTTETAPAADVWQSGGFQGAPGMSNFAASPVNSTFDIGFIQHEPGNQVTTPIDLPFVDNLNQGCLRYYTKSYAHSVKAGTASALGWSIGSCVGAVAYFRSEIDFPVPMAQNPPGTIRVWAYDGTLNACFDEVSSGNRGVNGITHANDKGFAGVNLTAATAGSSLCRFHWEADTGW
jgi:hypothetical protein